MSDTDPIDGPTNTLPNIPMFELVSNPEVKLADARDYYDGKITLTELAERSVDTVTGKPLNKNQAAFLAAIAVRIRPKARR